MMAARKVLGNDPFKRGAAVRAPARGQPPPLKPGSTRPSTPELQVPMAASPGRKGQAPRSGEGPDPVPHLHSPELASDPVAHADSPTLPSAPRPHPQSPTVVGDPVAHAGSPTLSSAPRPHPQSLAGDPRVESPEPAFPLSPRGASLPPEAEQGPVSTELPALAAQVAPASVASAIRGLLDAVGSKLRHPAGSHLDPWGKDVELARSLRPLAEVLYERYWRVQTTGIGNVPRGGCLLVANHAGTLPLDGPMLHLALSRERPDLAESRWLLEDQALAGPVVSVIANRLGGVRASPENAHRLLAEGHPVIVFPEGAQGTSKPFAERYQLRRFGRGYLKVALRSGVPVIPVAIVGAEEASPLLATLPLRLLGLGQLPITLPPLPSRWHIEFGAPIDLEGAPVDPACDPQWLEEKNLDVREQIQGMLTALLARRSRVF